jgi:hypothetical protein
MVRRIGNDGMMKKLFAIGMTGALIGAGLVGITAYGAVSSAQADAAAARAELEAYEPVVEYVQVPVPVEVPVEVIVEEEVLVDNGNLQTVLEFIEENHGNVNFIVTDLDEESVDEIVDRIIFINELDVMAEEAVRDAFRAEINNRIADNQEVIKFRDIERVRYEEPVSVIDDFEYWDATSEVVVAFTQDDVRYDATFEVVVMDGVVDDVRFVSVKAR